MQLRNARLLDRPGLWDVQLADGLIARVSPAAEASDGETIDLQQRLLLTAFVDAHLHLDKAYLNEDPTLSGLTGQAFFSALRAAKAAYTIESIGQRMRRALRQVGQHGTTTIRAQVDVDDMVGLRGLEAALALKEEVAEWLRLQIVAFPQEGLASNPRGAALMREALRLGADVVGGGATFDDGRIDAHVDKVFDLAAEFHCDVDLHADLATPADAPFEEWELARIVKATTAQGWQGRVTVAHLTQLGSMPASPAREFAAILAASGINVTVVPCAELNSATAWQSPALTSVDGAMSRPDVLLRNGVHLSYATGHVADPFSPYGCGDMLLDGLVLACVRNMGGPRIAGTHVLTLGTSNPARTLGLPGPHAVLAGALADLVCLDALDADLALRQHAPVWLQVVGGRAWRC